MKRTFILLFILLVAMQHNYANPAVQLLSTSVKITVLNSLGNIVENAKITLYDNSEDYENEENSVAGPVFTDSKGRATIKNLEDKSYYVKVTKDDANNYGEGEQTGKLKKGKVNKFNIVISE